MNQCANRLIAEKSVCSDMLDREEYYLKLVSRNTHIYTDPVRQPILFSMRTVIDIYDKQIKAGDVKYNWLDNYNINSLSG